jgi:hypothetical protein
LLTSISLPSGWLAAIIEPCPEPREPLPVDIVVPGVALWPTTRRARRKRDRKAALSTRRAGGHDTSSNAAKKRFRQKAARMQKKREELARKLWKGWDEMLPDQRKLLGPKGQPKLPRPENEN